LSLPQESGKVVAQTCPPQARDAQRNNALRLGLIWILLKTKTHGELFSCAPRPVYEATLKW
jgi:hypothetical protein